MNEPVIIEYKIAFDIEQELVLGIDIINKEFTAIPIESTLQKRSDLPIVLKRNLIAEGFKQKIINYDPVGHKAKAIARS